MRREDLVRLQHMRDSAREAVSFVGGRGREEFARDRMLALAVLKSVEIIGEAASKVGEESRRELPELAWKEMVGIRHRLVHGYFDIDFDRVWNTVRDDLPELTQRLEAFLARQPGTGEK
jgi:uncharacterized protein with HEPN domain